ncbi:hypothetical protein [Microvirga makkahensis]|uniref:Uncharacterized protein n=1 Tax=Microvirga makkahensis TaxID=1128670 RepID=A0A7X3MP69_9HYPH|nr:hypothetical protein [Microvirga makkahensis]MXQ10465.1 hypothetical protein [Microvirga makkahensis]
MSVDPWPDWRTYFRPDFYLQDIPDIVATTRSTIYVLELKKKGITWKALQQMDRYLRTHAAIFPSCKKRVRGVLIGHHLARTADNQTIQAISDAHGPIRILTYAPTDNGHVQLSDMAPIWVSGTWRKPTRRTWLLAKETHE